MTPVSFNLPQNLTANVDNIQQFISIVMNDCFWKLVGFSINSAHQPLIFHKYWPYCLWISLTIQIKYLKFLTSADATCMNHLIVLKKYEEMLQPLLEPINFPFRKRN